MNQIQSQKCNLFGIAISKQGGRPENQDDLGWADTPLGFVLVVCDGMGGGPGGKTASCIAKNVFLQAIANSSQQASRAEVLKRAISGANEALYQKMEEMPNLRGMGSTLVAILINEQSSFVVHLGDSRCYQVRKGHIVFRTKDHSLVEGLVQNKAMTEEQARVSPQSNIIMRGLGNTSNHTPEIEEIPYCKGDRFILCTDGVWGIMPHGELAKRLTSVQDIGSLTKNLSAEIDQRGLAAGGHYDNHTLAVIEIRTNSILKDKMNKQAKIIIGILTILLVLTLLTSFFSPFSGHQSTKIEELNAAIAEKNDRINKLESYERLYEDMKNSSSSELMNRIEVLEYEKTSLQEFITELMDKIDDLETKIEELSKPIVTKPNVSSNTSSSAHETAQRIVNQLEDMKKIKGDDYAKTLGRKAKVRNTILSLLRELDRQTSQKYHSRIDAVSRELKHKKSEALLIQHTDDNHYESTMTARKKIDQLSSKINDIKNQL